ncbi:MAG TPA: M23 family metallopeptidase [Bacteroidales bacterium]|nr:M23 family metallopeptidase [Bacteroidales bacterium]
MRPGKLLVLLAILALSGARAQGPSSKGYFRSPVDYPITLAGSFGEIRRNHFHSGIDIRTGGVQGKPVYAVADGYVSRINISPGGFGKALYVTHPNGFTSLYGHLRNLTGAIAAWAKEQQYKKESFAIDLEVPAGVLKVKKGEVIAYSGNSGASGGPHLHFEIRDTKTQEIIDPADFGLLRSDGIPPRITRIKVYPRGFGSMVNFSDKSILLPVSGAGSQYRLKTPDTLKVTGSIVFGIETSDNAEGGLKTGVRSIELALDGKRVFYQDMDRFAFAETRYVNSVLDYPAFVRMKQRIQRSYVAPNNKLSVFSGIVDQGVLNFVSAGRHRVRYTVKDAFGNSAVLEFPVVSHPPAGRGGRPQPENPGNGPVFTWKEDNHFTRPDVKLDVPSDAVYEDYPFDYSRTSSVPGTFSSVHHLQDDLTPLHTWCTLSIRPESLPPALQSKALIVAVSPGGRLSARGGTYENGWITTRIRDYGNFAVATDTENPVIRPMNIYAGKKASRQSSIQVKISDNLAGIKTYRGTLNGKWILMDYDEKSHLLTYVFDERMKPGKNRFELTVTDGVGNTSRYSADLVR